MWFKLKFLALAFVALCVPKCGGIFQDDLLLFPVANAADCPCYLCGCEKPGGVCICGPECGCPNCPVKGAAPADARAFDDAAFDSEDRLLWIQRPDGVKVYARGATFVNGQPLKGKALHDWAASTVDTKYTVSFLGELNLYGTTKVAASRAISTPQYAPIAWPQASSCPSCSGGGCSGGSCAPSYRSR